MAGSSSITVKVLFGGVLVLAPVQYWLATVHSEPYPALLMPRFEGAGPSATEPLELRGVDVRVDFATGEPARMTPVTLLTPLPDPQVIPLMLRLFGPEHVDVPAADSHLSQSAPAAGFLPGLRVRRARANQRQTDPATRAWLARRIESLFPRRRAVAVSFVWSYDRYVVRDGALVRSRLPAGTYVIALRR